MFKQVMEHFDNQVDLARQLGVTKAAISKWKSDNAFPPRQCLVIERLTNGKVSAADLILHYYNIESEK